MYCKMVLPEFNILKNKYILILFFDERASDKISKNKVALYHVLLGIKNNTSGVLHSTLVVLFFHSETTRNDEWQHLRTLHCLSGHKNTFYDEPKTLLIK